MIAEGLLMEIGEAPYRGGQQDKLPKGRRKILLDINNNYKFVLGAVIGEQEITVGLCTMHMDILDKASMPCTDHTSRKEIFQFIINASERMMNNSCLTRADVLGLGIGVMPIMIGRMRVFYKDGTLDFSELLRSFSAVPHMPPVFCGNAVWLLSLANADIQRNGMQSVNQVYLHLGSHIHISVLRPEKSEQDYLTYSYLTERCIVRPGGRQQDGYPAGSVRAQLSVQAMQARIAEVYSKERTPFLYSATDGYIERVTLEQMYQAVATGDKRCEEVVKEIMQDWSVLLHNLVCSFQAQQIVLHHFGLSERGFSSFRHYVKELAGDDIAERIVCSGVEDRTDFLAGCSLVLLKNFYMNGGIPETEGPAVN
jgi:predicted NBD/HSP70 family sugar kinase